ncbi:alpha/beta-hydrolase [Mytilinidion resinicola]|uniref:Alpha/beta-hydrolase n=1 Tax=Mytilinidion resinicola TaxID=574789 RepID=A0A6A6Y731_9PEZI|nr:alpha/beta-hydrolase [Mytilinidion resinicola]KAF2804338.1 alpha/beta-hydrolase [Mytilinidion resinicola]
MIIKGTKAASPRSHIITSNTSPSQPSENNHTMAQPAHSEACCTIPPVSADYTEKGKFIEIDGLKTYATGPEDASIVIILIYDVFGFGPQILQGADLLAHPSKHPYRVLIPDFLAGNLANPAWFPPDTPEKRTAMGTYFGPQGPGNAATMLASLMGVVKAIKTADTVNTLGVVGYCWGAKIVSLSCAAGTPFAAGVELHPSGLDTADAPNITVPLCMLASEDEDADAVKAFGEALTVPKLVERFEGAPHGWMTSRGDLSDVKGKADYERGYATVMTFFHEHL